MVGMAIGKMFLRQHGEWRCHAGRVSSSRCRRRSRREVPRCSVSAQRWLLQRRSWCCKCRYPSPLPCSSEKQMVRVCRGKLSLTVSSNWAVKFPFPSSLVLNLMRDDSFIFLDFGEIQVTCGFILAEYPMSKQIAGSPPADVCCRICGFLVKDGAPSGTSNLTVKVAVSFPDSFLTVQMNCPASLSLVGSLISRAE